MPVCSPRLRCSELVTTKTPRRIGDVTDRPDRDSREQGWVSGWCLKDGCRMGEDGCLSEQPHVCRRWCMLLRGASGLLRGASGLSGGGMSGAGELSVPAAWCPAAWCQWSIGWWYIGRRRAVCTTTTRDPMMDARPRRALCVVQIATPTYAARDSDRTVRVLIPRELRLVAHSASAMPETLAPHRRTRLPVCSR